MQKVFISDDGFPREITRSRAHGYKKIVISEDVTMLDSIKMVTQGDDTLVIEKCESTEEQEEYVILCKEFGVCTDVLDYMNKISIIYCDGGWMLVTLKEGFVALTLNGELMLPNCNCPEEKMYGVTANKVKWLDVNSLMCFVRYYKEPEKQNFLYDYEYSVLIGGNSSNFSYRMDAENDKDISYGYIALYRQQKEVTKQAKSANKLNNLFSHVTRSEDTFDDEYDSEMFEDDDEEYEEEED